MALLQQGEAYENEKRHSLYATSNNTLGGEENTQVIAISSDDAHQDDGTIISINVGGQMFKTFQSTLKKIKGSKLETIAEQYISSPYNDTGEIFYDRNPDVFAAILDFCRYSQLHIPKNTCVLLFRNELEYWGVDECYLSECCKKILYETIDDLKLNESLALEFQSLKPKKKSASSNWREKIFDVLYYPETSLLAKVYAFIYYILVVVTVFTIFLATVPSCRVAIDGAHLPPYYQVGHDHNSHNTSSSTSSDYIRKQLETNKKLRMLVTTRVAPELEVLDVFCLLYFTFDFIARVLTVPNVLNMFKQFFTFCDLMYLVPVWILWIVHLSDEMFWRQPEHIMIFLILECLIVARVVALFRLANQYRELRILVLSLRASIGEILLLIVFVIYAMIVFSSLIYCVEIFIVGTFETMFHGLWWSIVTMTTVGYGDMVPASGLGYLVACLCAMTGIILIGMVVPIITSNFHKYYGFRHRQDNFSGSCDQSEESMTTVEDQKEQREEIVMSDDVKVSENIGRM